ncbi:hypothetical protein LZ30DRAFT_796894 [Colletotrichum cereale]|nr:hypothetical protein LZ30DRAFT_796894 [Colletotrichum cereale]
MAGPQPSAGEAVDDVDSKALVGIGRKLKRKQQETVPDADDPRPRKRAENDDVDAPENNTTIVTAKYTVGWVCALPLEMAAARGMLDEVHPNLPEQDAADHNSYVLGQDLLRTFKSIRFGLMVGIGGGAPSKTHDIRLGDVVVSQPTDTSGAVIQYDRGKTVQEGEFQRTGSLIAPPQVLLAALSRLQADYRIVGSRIPQFLRELITKSPKRMKKKFGYQGASNDYLFHAGYHHVNKDSTCEHCDQSQTVERDARDDTDPVIHYGNIASGNQVIKNATTRDRLSNPELHELVSNTNTAITAQTQEQEARYENQLHLDCHRAFKTSTYEQFKNINRERVPGTCKWNVQKEVHELWCIFLSATMDGRADNITCVIDALDECCVEDRQKLICYLTDFHNQRTTSTRKTQLKFLATSRPYQDIESEFNDIPEPESIRLAGEDSNANISNEINLVIQDRVATAGRKHGMSQDVQNALQEKLSTMPHRTYLWLHLVMGEVDHNPKRHKRAFIKELDSLPTTVEDAYEKILGRLNHNRRQRQDTETLLHIVVGAHRPLTVSEMDVAFQLATDGANAQVHDDLDLSYGLLESQIRELCGLFVFINDSRIYLIHQTAKEFLVTINSLAYPADNLWKHSFHELRSDAVIGKVCVQYLCFNNIREDADTDPTQYPFFDYSATYWPVHSRKAMSTDEDLLERVLRLYDRQSQRVGQWRSISWTAESTYREMDRLSGMHLASFNGHDEVLRRQIAMNHTAVDVETPLYAASSHGHDKIVQMLLDKGAADNAQGGRYDTALQVASSQGYEKIVQILLNSSADTSVRRGVRYNSALQAASFQGHDKIVQMLLNKGADVNAQEGHHGTALRAASCGGHDKIAASSRGHDKTVQILINNGADVNAQGGLHNTSALQNASSKGHDKVVRILLDSGADVNTLDNVSASALWYAAEGGHARVLQMLLDSGADVNKYLGSHDRALRAAEDGGHDKIVQMLLDKR